MIKVIFILIGLSVLVHLNAFSQYIQNGSSISQTSETQGRYGPMIVRYRGISYDGYMKFPKSILVNYNGKVKEKPAFVAYKIFTESNFQMDIDYKNLKYNSDLTKLNVEGFITSGKDGEGDTLAIFREIIYTSAPSKFSGWIIAKNSIFGKSNTSLFVVGKFHSSCDDFKFSGKNVAFFKIEKDFTLTFDPQPRLIVPQPGSTSIKK
jgi:hypothetical protein